MPGVSVTTPCPAPLSSGLPYAAPASRINATHDVTLTAEFDYTRAISLPLTAVPPRRRSTFRRQIDPRAVVTVFEDVVEDQELVVQPTQEPHRSALLARPVRRASGLHSRTAAAHLQPTEVSNDQPLESVGQARRRSSMMPPSAAIICADSIDDAASSREPAASSLKKNPRRRTIFVPSDDTTILTIHPGARSTDPLDDTFRCSNAFAGFVTESAASAPQTEVDRLTKQAHRPRPSLAASPKRRAFRPLSTWSSNAQGLDAAGTGGGKENDPPSHPKPSLEIAVKQETGPPAITHSRLFESTTASQARRSVHVRSAVPLPPVVSSMTKAPARRRVSVAPTSAFSDRAALPVRAQDTAALDREVTVRNPGHAAVPTAPAPQVRRQAPSKLHRYPILAEDLAHPELYEDGWLCHQEVSLTEVINAVFADADRPVISHEQTQSLRTQMIAIYNNANVTALHQRLQASLMYGALSRPKDNKSPMHPAMDLSLRKRFLSLWLRNYDAEALQAAAEVVFGRQIPRPPAGDSGVPGTIDPWNGRRELTSFLETLLVTCDDVERPELVTPTNDDFEILRWRKTMLRSLMLIWLLDQAKLSQTVTRCLFQQTSNRKTSHAILDDLSKILLPSVGDIARSLRHLHYELSHVQDPLDEVEYCIHNIAVDFRDGVFLTRLVELLLFSKRRGTQELPAEESTVTIQMPDLTILESLLCDHDALQKSRVLSKHLKMPCLGRAQKIYNVQIALSALNEHGQLHETNESHITADDIVNGHREKTLSLLWALVASHGLQQLIDWETLTNDLGRRTADNTLTRNAAQPLPQTQAERESLLKAWATAHCAPHGQRISNLTTSFADGRAYAAIVANFALYLTPPPTHAIPPPAALEHQLRALGCSAAFTAQLAATPTALPSRRTTLANLAFLAARLLPFARRAEAAVALQRMYRARRARGVVSRRVVCLRLAHACAAVVRSREAVGGAATVLQRRWRAVLDARARRLERDVTGFQTVARAWLAVRRSRSVRDGGAGGGDVRAVRVMGGW